MAILLECPVCHKKQSIRNKLCNCGENLDRAKKAQRVKFWINYRKPDGKAKRESVGYSLAEAKDAEGKRRVQIRENRFFDIKPDSKMSFNELSKWYIGLEGVKRLHYYETIKYNLKSFNEVFGDMVINQLKPVDLENYQAKRKLEGLSDSYIDQQIGAARTMVTKAFYNDLIGGYAVRIFSSKKIKKLLKHNANARDRILTTDELDKLLDNLPQHTRGIVATGFYTGMRRGEILSLTWDKVNMKDKVINLDACDTKDKEKRLVPICASLYAILNAIPHAIHDNHVFLFRGKPVRDIRTALEKACKKIGIPYGRSIKDGFVFHDTRHSFNTNMRKSGVPESVIMKITGHSTREMFLRYDTVDTFDKRNAVCKMDDFLTTMKKVDQIVDQVPNNQKGDNQ